MKGDSWQQPTLRRRRRPLRRPSRRTAVERQFMATANTAEEKVVAEEHQTAVGKAAAERAAEEAGLAEEKNAESVQG